MLHRLASFALCVKLLAAKLITSEVTKVKFKEIESNRFKKYTGLATANRSRVSIRNQPCQNFPHIFDHHAKFGCFSYSVHAFIGGPKYLGDAMGPPLGWGRGYPLETCFSHAKFSHSRSDNASIIMEIRQKK